MKGAVIKRMVLDASVAVAWCFEDESSDFTEGVLDLLASGTEALAPAIWPLELVNALLMALMILCLIAHEITGYIDLRIAMRTRKVTAFEQQVHSVLEMMPLAAIQESHDDARIKKDWPQRPNPRRWRLFEPRSATPEENLPSPAICRRPP